MPQWAPQLALGPPAVLQMPLSYCMHPGPKWSIYSKVWPGRKLVRPAEDGGTERIGVICYALWRYSEPTPPEELEYWVRACRCMIQVPAPS